MSKHKQPGGIWTARYAHCAVGQCPCKWTINQIIQENMKDSQCGILEERKKGVSDLMDSNL